MTKLIVVEGADRTGKKTQTNLLAKRLREQGKKVAVVEVPYRSFLTYPLIYKMLKNGMAVKHPNLFQFVQFLNKLSFQLFVLPLMMLKNDYVVFDRWSLSSVVYGSLCGANVNFVSALYEMLAKPDVTLILGGPSRIKVAEDDYERNTSLQENVAKAYASYVDGEKFVGIDSSRSIDSTHQELWMCVSYLEASGKL